MIPRRAKLLLILVVVAGSIFLYDLTKRRGVPRVVTSLAPAALQVPLPLSPGKPAPQGLIPEERWRAIQERSAQGWGRDPFLLEPGRLREGRPLSKPGAGIDLKVTGIVRGEGRSHAVINDFVVRVGDEIAGARVVAIERDRVVLLKEGQQQILKLGE